MTSQATRARAMSSCTAHSNRLALRGLRKSAVVAGLVITICAVAVGKDRATVVFRVPTYAALTDVYVLTDHPDSRMLQGMVESRFKTCVEPCLRDSGTSYPVCSYDDHTTDSGQRVKHGRATQPAGLKVIIHESF